MPKQPGMQADTKDKQSSAGSYSDNYDQVPDVSESSKVHPGIPDKAPDTPEAAKTGGFFISKQHKYYSAARTESTPDLDTVHWQAIAPTPRQLKYQPAEANQESEKRLKDVEDDKRELMHRIGQGVKEVEDMGS